MEIRTPPATLSKLAHWIKAALRAPLGRFA
jgi:hypothetical protein